MYFSCHVGQGHTRAPKTSALFLFPGFIFNVTDPRWEQMFVLKEMFCEDIIHTQTVKMTLKRNYKLKFDKVWYSCSALIFLHDLIVSIHTCWTLRLITHCEHRGCCINVGFVPEVHRKHHLTETRHLFCSKDVQISLKSNVIVGLFFLNKAFSGKARVSGVFSQS